MLCSQDGICGGGLENATMEKTAGRWSYQSQPVKVMGSDKHSTIHKMSDVTCSKIRTVEVVSLVTLSFEECVEISGMCDSLISCFLFFRGGGGGKRGRGAG